MAFFFSKIMQNTHKLFNTCTIHKIVPDADTVIILRSPQTAFVPWECADPQVSANSSSLQVTADATSAQENTTETSHTNGAFEVLPDEVRYEVSSSQLKLASWKFNSMLSGNNWKEGIANEKDGRFHIETEDWDKDALLILLNVLHLRNSHPRQVASLEMLAKVVVLAEYYDCLEAIEFMADSWIRALEKDSPIPQQHSRDLMLWMCIAWVLELPEDFTKTTAVAIQQSRQKEILTSGLPITSFVGRSE